MAVKDTLSDLLTGDTESPTVSCSRDNSALCCPVCRRCSWERAPGVRGVPLSRCAQCGLLGTNHFLIAARTTEGLYDVGSEDFDAYQKQYLPHRLELYARLMPQLEPFCETGRLLEIGSGYGYFLEMAGKAGWKSEGVEISPFCCQVARQRGCSVQQGRLEDAALVQGTFDLIILWDVIEHFTKPDEIVSVCHSLLRPGGALVMRTPDGRALAPTFWPGRALYRHLVYPANTPEHVFHFAPRDLAALVTKSGFRVHSSDVENPWKERVISGNNRWVLTARRLIMSYAHWRAWPYEFVLTAMRD